MTNFQYRGFPYTPTTSKPKRTPMPLVYRGVAHDGMTQEPARNTGAKMMYRGIAYVRAATGQIVTIEETTRSPFGAEVLA